MSGVDIAFYLIHSMEGSSKDWKNFAERDRIAAENFAKAATECSVRRIIYLGGLTEQKNSNVNLSEHLRSRAQVGNILKSSSAKVTIFQAAVILGEGGGSFKMLRYLVERLPAMICPKWVLTKSQPISVDDVVTYLVQAVDVKDTADRTFDIGGPDILTYVEMMGRYAKMMDKSIRVMIIPFLTPRLSSYWVDLVTPVKASLARPLIDSLKHEAVVKDHSVGNIIPIKLKSFEESIQAAKEEQTQKTKITKKEHISRSVNNKILLISLFAMAAIGSSYYVLDAKPEIFHINWLILGAIWYFGIAFSIYFVVNGARLGALTAGIIGWITLGFWLAFWLIENVYTGSGNSFIMSSSPDSVITVRNLVGAVIAALVIAEAHNVFHEIRLDGL
jgi:uncharacterized protein YbjT (DUF2867 family)